MIIVNPRKLEHGFRMIIAGIPSTLPLGQEDNDVPTFWLLLYTITSSQRHWVLRGLMHLSIRLPRQLVGGKRARERERERDIYIYSIYIYIYIYRYGEREIERDSERERERERGRARERERGETESKMGCLRW